MVAKAAFTLRKRNNGERSMKSLATVLALTIAAFVTAPAFAQTITPATTQAECEKNSDMRWDDQSKTCIKK
jgi:hypothetical protein